MFLLKMTINHFDDIYFSKRDVITIIKIDFLNYIKAIIFKNFDIMI